MSPMHTIAVLWRLQRIYPKGATLHVNPWICSRSGHRGIRGGGDMTSGPVTANQGCIADGNTPRKKRAMRMT